MKPAARAILAALALIGPLFAAGCAADDTSPAPPDQTDTFTFAISGDPSSLNPINTGDRWGLTTTNVVYSPLARVEADGTVRNELAESIEPAADGRSVTVKLKPDVVWSDGEPLTAADVVFTYTNKAVKDNGNADLLWIGDQPITATAVDALTVRFDLPEASAAALSNIATETYIIPQHIYGDVTDFSGAELEPLALGSGPYKLVEYQRGEYLRFEANELYYGGAPAIQHLVFRIVPNADSVKTALQTGEVDGASVSPSQVADLAGAPVDIHSYAQGRVGYLGVIEPRVPDLALRQALFFALDREEINLAAYLDPAYFENAYSILPPGNPYATTDLERYDQDVERARTLLAAAGLNPTLVLAYAASNAAQATQATIIQQQGAAAGITIELSALDGTALYEEVEKGADAPFDLFLGGYIMGIDPDAYSLLFRTAASANFFSYSNPVVDALFDQGLVELDDARRETIYGDIQRAIAGDAIFYPILDSFDNLAINQRVGGVAQAKLIPVYHFEDWSKFTLA
ncbi:MAG: ABC transporter substrate-binding protein [Propionibacteriaceae bacterium]|jgi:peptide/nickel transport system substrate-binding protein|nr:ABC transporter substrate-binding protein [Propionibacteriaceae bacterium]